LQVLLREALCRDPPYTSGTCDFHSVTGPNTPHEAHVHKPSTSPAPLLSVYVALTQPDTQYTALPQPSSPHRTAAHEYLWMESRKTPAGCQIRGCLWSPQQPVSLAAPSVEWFGTRVFLLLPLVWFLFEQWAAV